MDVWNPGGWKLPGHWDGGSLEPRLVSIALETHGLIVDPAHLRQKIYLERQKVSCSWPATRIPLSYRQLQKLLPATGKLQLQELEAATDSCRNWRQLQTAADSRRRPQTAIGLPQTAVRLMTRTIKCNALR